jgi:hypothetical protein
MPTVQAALDAVRAELGEPGTPQVEGENDEPASRSENGDHG